MPTEMLKVTNRCKQQLLQKRLNTLATKNVGGSESDSPTEVRQIKLLMLNTQYLLVHFT